MIRKGLILLIQYFISQNGGFTLSSLKFHFFKNLIIGVLDYISATFNHYFVSCVAGEVVVNCPLDSILTTSNDCECAPEKCISEPVSCDPGLVKTLIRKGSNVVGECCDLYKCLPSSGEFLTELNNYYCESTGKTVFKICNVLVNPI